jgi:zinc/manganese transport system substrate-binding protein
MIKRFLFSLILILALTSACSPSANTETPANSGPKVLATETFLGDITQNVAGERLKIETLLPVTVDPHEFQPVPQDVIKISQSQVLIINGVGYESWLTNELENSGGQRLVIVASEGLTPNPDPSGEHIDGDPHMWMNPLNVVHYVENIRDGLIQADPQGKDAYSANADAYIASLKDLDGWVRNEVSQLPTTKRLLVTNHDALGYFAQAYGFTVVGAVIPSVTDEASTSAKEMADLIDTIKSSGVPAIFLDISENPELAQQVATESGAKVVTDLYVETLSAPDGPAPTYIEMIKHDVTVIVDALK